VFTVDSVHFALRRALGQQWLREKRAKLIKGRLKEGCINGKVKACINSARVGVRFTVVEREKIIEAPFFRKTAGTEEHLVQYVYSQ